MALKPKSISPLDASIASLLASAVEECGLSRRDLVALTGLSLNRIGIILRQEPPPATVGEVGLLAAAVGRSASSIIHEAESAASAGEHLTASDEIRLGRDLGTALSSDRAPDPGRARPVRARGSQD